MLHRASRTLPGPGINLDNFSASLQGGIETWQNFVFFGLLVASQLQGQHFLYPRHSVEPRSECNHDGVVRKTCVHTRVWTPWFYFEGEAKKKDLLSCFWCGQCCWHCCTPNQQFVTLPNFHGSLPAFTRGGGIILNCGQCYVLMPLLTKPNVGYFLSHLRTLTPPQIFLNPTNSS